MRIALIADTFPPLRTSGAVQLRDLSRELSRQGHQLTVLLPANGQTDPWQLSEIDDIRILRLKTPRTKDTGYIRRTIGEFLMPFAMRHQLKRSPLALETWDAVVWYAPSIFHGPLVKAIKKTSCCKAYLIIRDIFPDWAVDMGLMKQGGLPYLFFNAVARYQYSVANIIGVQTQGNLAYFEEWAQHSSHTLEVLQNWLGHPSKTRCSIRVNETSLAGRKIFVYAGNMGVAQGVDVFIELAEQLCPNQSIGFLFVGRGSELPRLKKLTQELKLTNVLFFDEIDPDDIPDLYAQCHAGIVVLDPRHRSHNIPGKFLTYMQSGLPVLASVNIGNDLVKIIRDEKVGQVCENNNISELLERVNGLLEQISSDPMLSDRCEKLFRRDFSVQHAAKQIIKALKN